MACCNVRVARLLLLVAMTSVASCTAACTSGILQMNAYPDINPDVDETMCWPGGDPVTANTIKALCNVAVKVTVTSTGVVKWAPVVQESYQYGGPGPYVNLTNMNCQAHNASGLFSNAAKSAASIAFYDDGGDRMTKLTKSSTTGVSLSIGTTYVYKGGPPPACTYKYTVVSGCVLGATPPPKAPACPVGYVVKTGAASTKYCSPCPRGTSSPGSNAVSCTPCPAGVYSGMYGSRCKQCPAALYTTYNESTRYAPNPGTWQCEGCQREQENKWSNATACVSCPAGSFWSPLATNQCLKCNAGNKCCTVNWTPDSGSCPKCAAGSSTVAPRTSMFVLDTASSASCLASTDALCTPKIKITVDSKCSITLSSLGDVPPLGQQENPCGWAATVPIRGPKINALVDLAQLSDWGNLTAASSSSFTFSIPSTKCRLQYRALTPGAAALLGVAPKPCPLGTPRCPSTANTCTPGHYLETASTARPAPCIRCRPGTYSSKASSGAPCTPCPAGTYARKYGSTKCTKCPADLIAPQGSAACAPCEARESYPSGPNSCTECPNNIYKPYPRLTACLAMASGSICCAAGRCSGQRRCPRPLPALPTKPYTAVLQLVKKSLPLPACKIATAMSCLQPGGLVAMQAENPASLVLWAIQAPTCYVTPGNAGYDLFGTYITPKRAFVGIGWINYVLESDKAKGTVTMYLSKDLNYYEVTDTPVALRACSATFKLLAGYAFDLSPPAGAKCPSNAVRRTAGGLAFCDFCTPGYYKKTAAACSRCPGGKYQKLYGATACTKTCPAGTYCPLASTDPQPCNPGTYSAKAGAASCIPCPKNTFASRAGAKACTKCPPLTKSPPGSALCRV